MTSMHLAKINRHTAIINRWLELGEATDVTATYRKLSQEFGLSWRTVQRIICGWRTGVQVSDSYGGRCFNHEVGP